MIMIDDDTLKQLLRIDDELMQLCKWLNEKQRHGNFISPHPSRRRPYPHFDRSGQEQITVMQQYKGYFITSGAVSVHQRRELVVVLTNLPMPE